MRKRWQAILVAALAALSAVPVPSRAQVTAPPDSLVAPRYRFTPVFNNRITADVSSVSMANEFHTGLTSPWGSVFDFYLSGDERNYRLQNRLEQNKRLSASVLHVFQSGLMGNASYNNSRVFNRSIAVGGGVQDFIINDQAVGAGGSYRKTYENLRMDVVGTGSAVEGERTFKNDRTLAAGMNGGVGYNLMGRRIVFQGRGALRGSKDRSSTVDSTFTGLGSAEDSLVTGVRVQFADSIRFDANYMSYSGERIFADQGRGSLGGQTGGAENVFEETENRDSRNTSLSVDANIFKRFGLKLTGSHDEQVFDYAIQTTRFSRTVTDRLGGTISYKLPWQTTSQVTFENNETLRDLGPQSVSSLTDKRKRVALLLSHRFTSTFAVDFNASSQLQQSFYLKYAENPRDRDQVDTNLNLRVTSTPFKKLSTNITVAYSISDFINIDATQSENNRTRELYEFRPGFSYFVNSMLTVIQTYGIAIEYTDYIYKPTQNFLDRNLTFTNEFVFRPTKKIDFRFEYALHLHDSGSYLPDEVTGERLLDVDSEDRRDRTRIRVDYTLTPRVKFFAENLYSQRQDWTPGEDERNQNTDGSITVGTLGDYDWGEGRKLRFQVSRVKRFSEFGADEEKNYWDARSEFAYPF